jgi:hypothetical protein
MEQRISHVRGLDIATPFAGRLPVVAGGFFGLESNVPSMLRGPTSGFAAAILFRTAVAPFGTADEVAESQFLCGSHDFGSVDDPAEGWAFVLEEGEQLNFLCGDVEYSHPCSPGEDVFALMIWDGVEAHFYVNGLWIASEAPVAPYVQGPDNFGIGGTSDSSFGVSVEEWGAVSVMIAGVCVGPFVDLEELFTASPAVEQYASVFSACDVVDAEPSPVLMGVTMPPSSYLWSARRGLPQLVDNGNETWADQVTGLELPRVGTQAGATVGNHAPNWADPDHDGL